MKINQIFNHNVVLSDNKLGEEVIVMGRGIAFQRKKKDEIPEELIDKVFVLANEDEGKQLKSMIEKLDSDEFELAKNIILFAEEQLAREFSDVIYITFADHLHYAIERCREGIDLPNPLLFEIKRFYTEEFRVALEALKIIEKDYDLNFSEGEAGFIALHFANSIATFEGMSITMESTEIVRDILSIISKYFGKLFDEYSLSYTRMVTHIQYFVQRILTGESYEEKDEFLYELIQSKYPKAFQCGLRINDYLEKTRQLTVQESEMIYLVIHINRVIQETDK